MTDAQRAAQEIVEFLTVSEDEHDQPCVSWGGASIDTAESRRELLEERIRQVIDKYVC